MSVTDGMLKRILEAAENRIPISKADYGLSGDAALDECKKNGWVEFRERSAWYDARGNFNFTAGSSGYIVLTKAGIKKLSELRRMDG